MPARGRPLTSEQVAKWNFRHGHSIRGKITPEYQAYKTAKKRCTNPKQPRFRDYGGRGIKFLFNSFQEFLNHIGRKPTPEHCLDRINNDGHYEIGNVRWATQSESTKNRRMTVRRLKACRANFILARKQSVRDRKTGRFIHHL